MSSIIDSANAALVWVNPVIQAPADKTLNETLKLTQSGVLTSGVSVTCVLEGTGVVFKNTQTNTCTGNTNVLGRLPLQVISLTGADTQFKINAHLTDSPSVQVAPLSVRFISKVNAVSLQPRKTISSPDKPVVLTATVTDKNGGALQGITVTFSASKGARLTPAAAITDENGQASTQVTRDSPGLVIVTATANGISDHTSVGFYYSVDKVTLTCTEPYVSVGMPVALTATVTDKNGGALQGITVTFSASDEATLTLASATTDKNGQASTWVTSDNSGLVTVSATANGISDRTGVEFHYPVDKVVLTCEETYVSVGTSVALTATVTDKHGGLLKGITVIFTAPGGTLTSATAITDEKGQASNWVTSDDFDGSFTVIATTANGRNDSTQIEFYYTVAKVSLYTQYSYDIQYSVAMFVATVTARNGIPMQGITVTFSTNSMSLPVPASDITDEKGQVSMCLHSSDPGTVTVTATAQGVQGSADLFLKKLGLFTLKETSSDPSLNEKLFILAQDDNENKLSNQKVYLVLIISKKGDIDLIEYDPHTYSNGEFSVLLKGTPGSTCRLQVVVGDCIGYMDVNFSVIA